MSDPFGARSQHPSRPDGLPLSQGGWPSGAGARPGAEGGQLPWGPRAPQQPDAPAQQSDAAAQQPGPGAPGGPTGVPGAQPGPSPPQPPQQDEPAQPLVPETPSQPVPPAPSAQPDETARSAQPAQPGFIPGPPGERIISTDRGLDHGLDKCPRCGSSDVAYSIPDRALVCGYCRNTWNEPVAEEAFNLGTPIEELQGSVLASASRDIADDATTMTIKCQGCGAEIVLKTDESLQARCHWCRQVLSVNHQIPNGAVPDAVLPFTLTREQGIAKIQEFVASRRGFANRAFLREFVPENVKGVYMPYMVVDGNLHAELRGTGEITTRRYTEQRRIGKDTTVTETFWDASVHEVGRSFDILVNDLATESSSRYSRGQEVVATNYVLDAIQPYDTAAAFAYNSNYLSGFTSERRDQNISDLDSDVEEKFLSIGREKVRPTIQQYTRGVRWEGEGVAVRGTRWVTMYVPVWLYSYYQRRGSGEAYVHYIAVNGRTGRTMGSVPVSHPRIFSVACAGATVAAALAAVVGWGSLFL